jgi:hypothetical protein
MNATRWMGLGLAMTALLAAGCSGAEAQLAGPARPAPPPPSPILAGETPTGGDQAGYAPPGLAPAPSAAPKGDVGAADSAAQPSARAQEKEGREEPSPTDRPGLGTEWGETRFSKISTVPFVRADASSPFAMTSVLYNDEEGARSMASAAGFKRWSSGSFSAAGGAVSLGLRDEGGRFLSGFVAGGKSFVVGEAGRRYSIVVHNNTDSRIEIVLSVDGLDVLDGKAASFQKRGYLVDPRGEVEVDGFRQSMDTVAAFRFGSVRDSYASQKTGDARNVGVIGVALFNERGSNPFPWTGDEVQKRRDANPFPGQFATPP